MIDIDVFVKIMIGCVIGIAVGNLVGWYLATWWSQRNNPYLRLWKERGPMSDESLERFAENMFRWGAEARGISDADNQDNADL